jgi:PAS domain S-box-containing protein
LKNAASPQAAPPVNDRTPLYNSGIIGNYVYFLESHHADVDIDDLLHCSGLSRFDINDEGLFLSQEQINAFHRCLNERIDDPNLAYRVGRHALYTKATGTMKRYGLQFITPAAMFKAVDRLYPRWSKGHLSHTDIIGKERAEIVVSVRPGVREEPFQCENRQGIVEAIGQLATGQKVQVAHPACMHRGDDACRYRIVWHEKPSFVWKRRGAYAGAASAIVAAGTVFHLAWATWLPAMLMLVIGCLSIFLFGGRLERKELARYLKEQGDTAGELLEQVEVRYQNSRLVQEVGQAGANILDESTFLEAVLETMSRNLDFKRGMIALGDAADVRLHHAASYGFSGEERRVLNQLGINIDDKSASGVFARSLESGKPFFLKNVDDHLDQMPLERADLLQRLHIRSIIGVPIVFEKALLGLFFLDATDVKEGFVTSDINLLMGIASQVASGIVNARSYARLQESEQRYRLLADNVADVIWVMDIESLTMRYVSPAVVRAQGFTPEEIMEMSIDRFLTPASFQKASTALADALASVSAGTIDPQHYIQTLELEELHKNGSVIPMEVTTKILLDQDGRPDAILGITRDLSERKKVERQRAEVENRLQQAKKMESLGTMAGSIAHNFNNLLMVVLGNLEIAKEELPTPSVAATNVQRAMNASQRAADLSNMMLTYVGQVRKESMPVDLSQIVTAVIETLDDTHGTHVELDLDLTDPMPLVAADGGQMRQVITGFVTNAVEALDGHPGRVRISTGSMHCDRDYLSATYLNEEMPEGMYAYVEVSDTGCGMDADTLSKVFDPFFSTKFTGRGLGLAAILGIVRAHNGAIKVASDENQGSVFTALFPIQRISLRQPKAVHPEADAAFIDGTVLLVDDEAMVKDIGNQFLTHLGYRPLTASSGQEAVDLFRRDPDRFDCLLIDYTMPGWDGLETLRQIRSIRPDARVLITSGYTRQQIEHHFDPDNPPDGFIQKPFEMKSLQETLRRVMTGTDDRERP